MTTAEANTEPVRLWPYVKLFIPIYLGLSIAAAVVLFALDIETNVGVNVAVLVASLVVPINRFVLDRQRPFEGAEQLRFSLLIFLVSILASLALLAVAGVIAFSIDESTPSLDELLAVMHVFGWEVALSVFVRSLAYLAVIYFFSGFQARFLAKRLAGTGKT